MKVEKREFELLMLCLSLAIIIIGVLLNYAVIVNNHCRMPVVDGEYSKIMDDKHFFFEHKESINYYYLSDIIIIFKGAISIGDILIFIGMIGSFGFSIRYLIRLYSPVSIRVGGLVTTPIKWIKSHLPIQYSQKTRKVSND